MLLKADRTLEKIVEVEIKKDEAVRERMATHTRIKKYRKRQHLLFPLVPLPDVYHQMPMLK